MESDSILNDLQLSGTSSEEQSQPSFIELVDSSVQYLSPEVNSFDYDQVDISQLTQTPAVNESSAISDSGITNLTPETFFKADDRSQTSETFNIIDEDLEKIGVPSDQNNSFQQDISSKAAVNIEQPDCYYTDSKPGTSSEWANHQSLGLFDSETGESSTTLRVPSTGTDQHDTSQQHNLPGNKTRRRQRRRCYKDVKPTRESQRKRKCPQIMTYEKKAIEKSSWTMKDKKELLKALEQWGPVNTKALHAEMPNKHERDIINQIKMWRKCARVDLQKKLQTEVKRSDSAMVNCITRLDEWIQHFAAMEEVSTNKLFSLSNVFLLIAEYGNFPPPSNCNGVDFRAMYRYIHCMLNGIPYFGVNQKTAKVLNNSITDMFALMKEHEHVSNLQPHLYSNSLQAKQQCRTYGRPSNRKVPMFKDPNAIVNLPGINPLKIPPHVLSKPDIDEYEYDEDDIECIKIDLK